MPKLLTRAAKVPAPRQAGKRRKTDPDTVLDTTGASPELVAYLKEALSWLGTKEVPVGSNLTQITRRYGPIPGYPYDGYGYPWCMAFCWVVGDISGSKKLIPRTASTIAAADWFKQRGAWGSTPRVGALVFFGRPKIVHVEIVTRVYPNGDFQTIGGNTSGQDSHGRINPNGDGCYTKRIQGSNPRINGFGYPAWPGQVLDRPARKGRGKHSKPKAAPKWPGRILTLTKPRMSGPDVKAWKLQMIERGYSDLTDSPVFGRSARDAAMDLQRKIGIAADGRVGRDTFAAAWEHPND
ncbi:CHAP domain-containing protein [Nonomuraea sp. NPDC050556]|uniref:CHAP domain-containing protein n=1 Tax=Nonomuraea sp. NPDC050556 TaxID=3364369 RepID=UPI0037A1B9D4